MGTGGQNMSSKVPSRVCTVAQYAVLEAMTRVYTLWFKKTRQLWGNHAECCMDGKKIRCLQIVLQHLSSTVSQLFEPLVQKIAVFTYRSPHLCFPWRRPCDYHPVCSMDEKTVQFLPNPSQHVPIYIQYFPIYVA